MSRDSDDLAGCGCVLVFLSPPLVFILAMCAYFGWRFAVWIVS